MRSLNYFLRLVKRQKNVTFFSVFSLSLGIAIALLIGLSAWEEYSFDDFHQDKDQIYRIYTEKKKSGDINFSTTFWALGDHIPLKFGEIKSVCRVNPDQKDFIVGQKLFSEIHLLEAEENFFTFFTFPLKSGVSATCLSDPKSMVISETIANRWFPDEDPIGQLVKTEQNDDYIISGVMSDMPYHSHLQPDVIIPFLWKRYGRSPTGDSFYTYLKIPEIKDKIQLEEQITKLDNSLITGMNWESLGVHSRLILLKDIHFSGLESDHSGNKTYVLISIFAALLILIMGCINFINLFISTSILRAKEIGIKKTMGINKGRLVLDFYMEAFYHILLSVGVGISLAVLLLPCYNQLTGYELSFTASIYRICGILVILLGALVLGAGTFPAFYMTRFGVVDTLSRSFKGKNLSFLQKALLVIQFVFSLFFLIMAAGIQKQVNYMVDYDLGINKENIICLDARIPVLQNYETIRNELLKESSIETVCLRDNLPNAWADGFPIQKPGSDELIQAEVCEVQGNYFELMQIPFVLQGNVWKDIETRYVVVINETGVKLLGLTDPLATHIQIWGIDWQVVGVVKDVMDKGVEGSVGLQVYIPLFRWKETSFNFVYTYSLMAKVKGDPATAIQSIKKQWETYLPNVPFKYHFLDQIYEQMYGNYQRIGRIFSLAVIIMLIISIAGLFALAYYAVQRRVKEMGIRKVNGAGGINLLILLNRSFMKWITIAWVIACLFAWWGMEYWLDGFKVRIALDGWVFVMAGLIAVATTWITVSILTWKIIRMKPVKTLRSE